MPWRHLRAEGHGSYTVAGRALACSLCGTAQFDERGVALPTEWASRQATQLLCRGCGNLLTFGRPD